MSSASQGARAGFAATALAAAVRSAVIPIESIAAGVSVVASGRIAP